MKILSSSRTLFIFGFVLLVITNIVVLAGVFSNRSGTHDATLTLTERELPLPYIHRKENSELALRIAWRSPSEEREYYDRGTPSWLNTAKLRELGFNLDEIGNRMKPEHTYRRPLPKEVFIVLEYDGSFYQTAVQQAEENLAKQEPRYKEYPNDKRVENTYKNAKNRLQEERISKSRLFAVDAGRDPRLLRKKYSDRSRYVITKGVVRVISYYNKEKQVLGSITKLSVATLHVPLSQRKTFDSILAQHTLTFNAIHPPRYEVKLAFGSRFEPWILSVHPLEERAK
jgi:Domain of unknown function (DUF4824)